MKCRANAKGDAESPYHGTQAPRYRRTLAGLFVRRERWCLSWRGKLLAFFAITSAVWIGHFFVYSWLSVTDRVSGQYLVVEGWIHNSGFKQAISEFNTGSYRRILISGGQVRDTLGSQSHANYAEWGADRLEKLGMSKELIRPVSCNGDHADRTYHAALAISDWFRDHDPAVTRIDVVSMGPHARRTRLLFQKALGKKIVVGVIAADDETYEAKHWWRSSEGVREVVGEAIAYLYARLFFHPARSA